MASGHVNRTYRPNTWLHRPSLRREDFSCQPGAVHTWHNSDIPPWSLYVRCLGQSGSGVSGPSGQLLTRLGHRLPNRNELRNLKTFVSAEAP
jgi:hypothetical protein